MKKSLLFFLGIFVFGAANADCMDYKISPSVNIKQLKWTERTAQPKTEMNSLHGSVAASFNEEYDLHIMTFPDKTGVCVVLSGVDAKLGYTEFLINIDRAHKKDSCEYNLTLKHEKKHIAAHISAFDNELNNMKESIKIASDSIMPIYIKNMDLADDAMNDIQEQIQQHPSIVLMKQKLNANQEILNKKVDDGSDNKLINNCK